MHTPIYDIIGDIHGHGISLKNLLNKLGYEQSNGIYQHPQGNKAVFLGDFIDRGPTHREVIDTVRPMIDSGHALGIMGNHEFNAICYHTPDEQGGYLRERSEKNVEQHEAFMATYPDKAERDEIINWFKTLPLWIELEFCRAVHACWHEDSMVALKPWLKEDNTLLDIGYIVASDKTHPAYDAVETLLKGVETKLPDNQYFFDKENNKRHDIRTKWWDPSADTYENAALPDLSDHVKHKRNHTTPPESRFGYPTEAKPLFIGHYWRKDDPQPLTPNVACVDYSIAKEGKLAAYRMRPGENLSKRNFYWVD